jgi:hypothetical protein
MDNKEEITLPLDIASDSLTLEEIGALVVLMAMPKMKRDSKWFLNKKLLDYLDYFLSEGIVTKPEGSEDLQLEIDLTWI